MIRQEDTEDTVQEKITPLYVLRRRIINKCERPFFYTFGGVFGWGNRLTRRSACTGQGNINVTIQSVAANGVEYHEFGVR